MPQPAGTPPTRRCGSSAGVPVYWITAFSVCDSTAVVADATPHRRMIEDFARAIEQGSRPVCDGREGLRSVAVVEAIYKAAARARGRDRVSPGGPLAAPDSSTRDRVVEHVRRLIEERELGPGDRLPGSATSRSELGLSRPSVRSGLEALEAMGVVVSRRGAGTFIAEGRPRSAAEPLRMQASLHRLTRRRDVRGAARARGGVARARRRAREPRELATLAEEVSEMFAALEDPQAFLVHDVRFHRAVAAACGNRVLAALDGDGLGAVLRAAAADDPQGARPQGVGRAAPPHLPRDPRAPTARRARRHDRAPGEGPARPDAGGAGARFDDRAGRGRGRNSMAETTAGAATAQPGSARGPLPLGDLRAAVLRHHHQLHRPPGARHPRARPAADHRLERRRVRLHRDRVPGRLRARPPARRAACSTGSAPSSASRSRSSFWSLAAMAHALARIGRSASGSPASRSASARRATSPPRSRRSPSGSPRRSAPSPPASSTPGTNVGAIVAPLVVPWIALHLGLAVGVHRSPALIGFVWLVLWLGVYRPPGDASAPEPGRARLHPQRPARDGRRRSPG